MTYILNRIQKETTAVVLTMQVIVSADSFG